MYVVLTVRDSTLGTAVIEVCMGHSSRVTCHEYSYFGSICPTLFCVQVQPHLKKCFDNIKSLDMARMRDHMEATHMNSSEGEKVELKGVVRLEGVVEVRGWRREGERERKRKGKGRREGGNGREGDREEMERKEREREGREGKGRESKEKGGEGERGRKGKGRSVSREWCYTTVCTHNTNNIHISSLFLFSIFPSPSLPLRAGCVTLNP